MHKRYNFPQLFRAFLLSFIIIAFTATSFAPREAYAAQGPQSLGDAVGLAIGQATACWTLDKGAGIANQVLGKITGLFNKGLGTAAEKAKKFLGIKGGGAAVPVVDDSVTETFTTLNSGDQGKDCIRDVLAKVLGDWLVDQTVTWIQGGGTPKFVTDWRSFAKDAASVGVGEVVNSTNIGFLCSPFQAQIKAAFFGVETFEHQIQCRLTGTKGIIDNIKDFWNDFDQGGWIGYTSSWEPQNHYFGAYLQMRDQALVSAREQRNAQVAEASAGGGYLSVKKCQGGEVIASTDQDHARFQQLGMIEVSPGRYCSRDNWKVVTPGDIVGEVAAQAVKQNYVWAANIKSWMAAIVNASLNRLAQGGIAGLISSDGGGFSSGGPSSRDGREFSGAVLTNTQLSALTRVNSPDDALEVITKINDALSTVLPLKQQSLQTLTSLSPILTAAQQDAACRAGGFREYNFSRNEISMNDRIASIQAELEDVGALQQGLGTFQSSIRDAETPEAITRELDAFEAFLNLHLDALGVLLSQNALAVAQQEAYEVYQQFAEAHTRYQKCASYTAPAYIPPAIDQPVLISPLTGQPVRVVRVDTRKVTGFGNYFIAYGDGQESADQFCTEIAEYPAGAVSDTSFSCKPPDFDSRTLLDYRVDGNWYQTQAGRGGAGGFCPGNQYVEWVDCIAE